MQTGGGVPEYIPPDDVLDRVADLLGSTASGFVVPFGGDREPEVVEVVEEYILGDGGSGDGLIEGQAGVLPIDNGPSLDSLVSIPLSIEESIMECNRVIEVTKCERANAVNETGTTPKRLTFKTPRTGNVFPSKWCLCES